MKYIAYGSNMSIEQMKRRCPDARLIGTGRVIGAQLEFYLHATVEESRTQGAYVPVAVWDISDVDEKRLDRYEGYPSYYIKKEWPVDMDDGSTLTGMIYLMAYKRNAPPEAGYYRGIREAYEELGLNSEIKTVLAPARRRSIRISVKAAQAEE